MNMDMIHTRTVSTAKSDSEHGSEGRQPQPVGAGVNSMSGTHTGASGSGFSTESSNNTLTAQVDVDDGVMQLVALEPPTAATLATAATATAVEAYPAEIPPETGVVEGDTVGDTVGDTGTDNVGPVDISTIGNDDDSEEEDDYEYEEDDDAPFVSGFLIDNPTIAASRSTVEDETAARAALAVPATIQDEDEEADCRQQSGTASAAQSGTGSHAGGTGNARSKWREPTRDAVKMSLRAEKETTGGKRRLAQDLYRIMNQDTVEAGFSLEPSQEDSMDKWTIKLFKFDQDSNLAKDMLVLGLQSIELEMAFPDQYPFEPPFVRVVRPRFKRQTGFVMNGALCMELLTKDGWNPINDIESVIVSVRSLLVVGDGRLEAAFNLAESKYNSLLAAADIKAGMHTNDNDNDTNNEAAAAAGENDSADDPVLKRQRKNSEGETGVAAHQPGAPADNGPHQRRTARDAGGAYSVSEAEAAYSHLSSYHKKKGWDTSGWWARKG
jgi:ubiquitin-conjugating enzyme E2 Q